MSDMKGRLSSAVTVVALLSLLTACSAGQDDEQPPTPRLGPTSGSEATPTPSPTPTPTPTAVALPTDCRAMLSEDVLSQIGETPLNDPAFGPSGIGDDGTLTCIWRDPGADTTGIMTVVSRMDRGPALDMLNGLADDEGFTCYTPDEGTRCEKTWDNPQYPVTDGRTLYWRDGILIDTRYSNVAPTGFTSSIVEYLFD